MNGAKMYNKHTSKLKEFNINKRGRWKKGKGGGIDWYYQL